MQVILVRLAVDLQYFAQLRAVALVRRIDGAFDLAAFAQAEAFDRIRSEKNIDGLRSEIALGRTQESKALLGNFEIAFVKDRIAVGSELGTLGTLLLIAAAATAALASATIPTALAAAAVTTSTSTATPLAATTSASTALITVVMMMVLMMMPALVAPAATTAALSTAAATSLVATLALTALALATLPLSGTAIAAISTVTAILSILVGCVGLAALGSRSRAAGVRRFVRRTRSRSRSGIGSGG